MARETQWKEDFIFRRSPFDPTAETIQFYSYLDSIWYPGATVGAGGGEYVVGCLVLEGDEAVDCARGQFTYHAGCFYLNCRAYRRSRAVGSRPLRRKAFLLYNTALHRELLTLMFHRSELVCPLRDLPRVERCMDAIREEMLARQDDSRLAGCYMELLHELHHQTGDRMILPDALRLALDYIEKNLGDSELSREKMAAAARIGLRTLCRLFEQHLGEAPVRYLIRRRLERVCQMLSVPTLSIKEIAERNGFADPRFLARSFHAQTGCTPQAYRQSLRSGAHFLRNR